jgi:hypothetical protein
MKKLGFNKYRQPYRQIVLFKGLECPGKNGMGKISPTDIDAFAEIHDKFYWFGETKFYDEEISKELRGFDIAKSIFGKNWGQRKSFETVTDDLTTKKPTIWMLTTHTQPQEPQDLPPVEFADTTLRVYRYKGLWRRPKRDGITGLEAWNLWLEKCGIKVTEHRNS